MDSCSLASAVSPPVLLGEYLVGEVSEEATLFVMPLSADYLGFNYIDDIGAYNHTVALIRISQIVELDNQNSYHGHCRSTRQ